jgi:hypothetical protein
MDYMNSGTGLMTEHGTISTSSMWIHFLSYLYAHYYLHLGILLGV